jgi:hypothetical protein
MIPLALFAGFDPSIHAQTSGLFPNTTDSLVTVRNTPSRVVADPADSASVWRSNSARHAIASLYGSVRDGLQQIAYRNQEEWQSRAARQLFLDKGETFGACRFLAYSAMLSRIERRPPELHRLSLDKDIQ